MTHRLVSAIGASAILIGLMGSSSMAAAQAINTGGSKGAYHTNFCPPIADALAKAYFNYACAPSAGSVENIARELQEPRSLGMAQADVFAAWAQDNPDSAKTLTIVRDDIARECVYMVTTNPALKNYGDIARLASRVPFILPAEKSGSVATFRFLQKNDPTGLGRATNITYAETSVDAVTQALKQGGAIALFVQMPDPSNPIFKTIAERHGNFVPVISRDILRLSVGDRKVYVPETDTVGEGGYFSSGKEVTTACTPVVFFTGDPAALTAGSNQQKDQSELVEAVKALSRDDLLPRQGNFAWLKSKLRETSQSIVDQMATAVERARQ